MKNFVEIGVELRRKNRKHYTLLSGCIFFSVLLITAYASIMRSPTVLAILPEGGDSRKMLMGIFALAAVGCGVFSLYSASLFFRYKSREAGIFMVLGASRKKLSKRLFQELALLSGGSCLAGALLGTPFAWCVWQLFRLCIVDTEEMNLSFDPKTYLVPLIFTAFLMASLAVMGTRFIRRANIIDIVNRRHISEPVRGGKPWFGPLGILLMAAGGAAGYFTSSAVRNAFHTYQVGWTKIFYLPFLIGLYMVLVYTVVHGWRQGKSRYKNIVSRSMMKFEGRQTVNIMLVLTVLIAGAYFSTFNTPMMSVQSILEINARPVDYAFHYRTDQKNMPGRDEIASMASRYGTAVAEWRETEAAVLGRDGNEYMNDDGKSFHYEYRKLLDGGHYLSESGYREITSRTVNIEPGRFARIISRETKENGIDQADSMLLTNMTTREIRKLTSQKSLRGDLLASIYGGSCFVLDDTDYAEITAGLSDEWKEKLVWFNEKKEEKSYAFAKQLFRTIVERSGPECEVADGYDRVEKAVAEEKGEAYWGDADYASDLTKVSYVQPDSAAFRMHWQYMPRFRVLDRNDRMREYAIFFTVFLFVSIVCFAAVLLIGYTRCITVAMNNRQVYGDLRRLGASPGYLYRAAKGTVSKTFGVPALLGTLLIFAYFLMILYFNDGMFTQSEGIALLVCMGIVLIMSLILWAFSRFTLRRVCGMLEIKKEARRGRKRGKTIR